MKRGAPNSLVGKLEQLTEYLRKYETTQVAFNQAVLNERLDVIQFLLTYAANEISAEDKRNAYRYAVSIGQNDVIQCLLTYTEKDILIKEKSDGFLNINPQQSMLIEQKPMNRDEHKEQNENISYINPKLVTINLNAEVIDELLQYSSFIEERQKIREDDSTYNRMKIVQNEWHKGDGLGFQLKKAQRFHHRGIDASAGSSGFEPEPYIVKEIKNIPSLNLIEYVDHLPSKKVVHAVETYFKKINILDKDTKLAQDVYDNALAGNTFCVIGHGTTELFNHAIQNTKKNPDDIYIVTEPTYGLFVPLISDKKKGIATLKLNPDSHYKPQAKELVALIQEKNAFLLQKYTKEISVTIDIFKTFLAKKIPTHHNTLDCLEKLILKYEILLHPLQNTTQQCQYETLDEQTKEINQLLKEYFEKIDDPREKSSWKKTLKLPPCPRVRGFFNINPQMPIGTICTQMEVNTLANALNQFKDVIIIDDLSYYELVLPPSEVTPGTFAKSCAKDQTLTLYSLSKQFALAGVRSGIALGPQHLIQPIAKAIFNTVSFPSTFTTQAFTTLFELPDKKREKYIAEVVIEYAFRRDLAIAIFKGIDHIKQAENKKKIIATLDDLKICKEDQKALLEGINGLNILIIPDSGFFLLLDFSQYKGKYLGSVKLETSRDFRQAFYSLIDLNTIPAEMAFYFDKPILRYSLCIEPLNIIESGFRIRNILSLCRNHPLDLAEEHGKQILEKSQINPITPTFQMKKKPEQSITVPSREIGKRKIKPNPRYN